MTVKTIRVCDRCGKEAERNTNVGPITIDGKVARRDRDLCNKCFALLERFMRDA